MSNVNHDRTSPAMADACEPFRPKSNSPLRIIVLLLVLIPAVLLGCFQFVAQPDPGYWLSQHTIGQTRRDAFDGVTSSLPLTASLFHGTSFLAALLIWSRHSKFLVPLAVGPMLAVFGYLMTHGISDPAWHTLLGLLTIGMIVGSPVTLVWWAVTQKPS